MSVARMMQVAPFANQPSKAHPATITFILILHAALLYGLARDATIRHAQASIRHVMLIPEISLPALPPPPKPPQPTPKKATGAPDPLPERATTAPPTPNIVTTSTEPQTAPVVIQPPAPIAVAVAVAAVSTPTPTPAPLQPRVAKIELPSSDAQYLNNPIPSYPALSKRMNEQGRVMLRVLVGVDGAAQQVELKTSSGFDRLDIAAIKAVSQWRFVPGKRNAQPEAMWFNVPVDFELS